MAFLNPSLAKTRKVLPRKMIARTFPSRCSPLASGVLIGFKTPHILRMLGDLPKSHVANVSQRKLQTSCLPKRDYCEDRLCTQRRRNACCTAFRKHDADEKFISTHDAGFNRSRRLCRQFSSLALAMNSTILHPSLSDRVRSATFCTPVLRNMQRDLNRHLFTCICRSPITPASHPSSPRRYTVTPYDDHSDLRDQAFPVEKDDSKSYHQRQNLAAFSREASRQSL